MGRPSASAENRAFSVCFAHAVTKQSHCRLDFVARSGPLSLFSSLAKMFPAYARTEDGQGFRDGVSEVQFNKELQKNGFQRVRDRRTCATRRSEDPTGAGMYLFSHLKWRDPSDPEDLEVLMSKFEDMVKKFPLIMLACKADKFLDIVTKFHKDWIVSTEQMGNFVEGEGEESDNSENHQQAAHRSTSVSPSSMANQRILVDAIPNLFHPATPVNAPVSPFGMPQMPLSQPMSGQPMTPVMGMPGVSPQDLNAIQNQLNLSSSLLAVTFAKQQLHAASLPLSDMGKPLLSPYNNPALSTYALQHALLNQKALTGMPSPAPHANMFKIPELPMGMS